MLHGWGAGVLRPSPGLPPEASTPPMCAWCGRIRTEDGDWESVSSYLKRVADTDVSHGLCPSCEREQLEGLEAG